ncbi:TonB-dependent receptor [Candidatus Marinarcus aquaticus]|uniref:TonB-dependent siderophore receptor n=1 Tax=Candidatus Marinarcus aquaticus TaxID=2044504 RepID=A0A4Q0XTZ6_9BACT|nr:TonB-dependent receptor [Candidatus Marinarcus aquaticus]RXJ57653.1 TonB-dependent siderophore receptor [Candidatus Marinarcus aquaticus]
MKKWTTYKVAVLSLMVSSMLWAAEQPTQLGNVVVSANKMEENIQEVPQSITILDAQTIEEKGMNKVSDVINVIPNMYMNSENHGGAINFRGLNTSMFTNSNPIVIYVDGVPTSSRNAFDISMENIEKIEVLRGPQGTLYGKDAIGGVINIITKVPTNETSGSIGFEYGSNDYHKESFNLNTPLIKDKLFLNLNAALFSDHGWITNDYNGDDEAAKERSIKLGTSLYYNVTDNLSAKLVFKREKTKNYWGNYGVAQNVVSLNEFSKKASENANFDMPAIEDNEINTQSLNLKYETDDYLFEAISSHKDTDFKSTYDIDFTANNLLDGSFMTRNTNMETYTNEVRVSNKSDAFRWIAGVYFDSDKIKEDPYSQTLYLSGVKAVYANALSTSHNDTSAIFTHLMIPLNEKIDLTLGGRYQRIKKDIDMTVNNGATTFDFDANKTWNTFIPKGALSYKINDNFTTYFSVSKGYMAGGFNSFASSSNEDDNAFDSQKSTNYEIGIKSTFDDLILNAAIFRMDIENIHIYRQVVGNYYTDNAKKAHSQGIELDFTYFPTDTIVINGAVGYVDTEYDSYDAGDYDFSGNKIENTPSHTANLSMAYYDPKGFYARGDIKNQGSLYFYDDRQKKFLKNKSYTTLDVKIGYRYANFDIYAYGKNLTDEEYMTYYQSSSTVSLATFADQRSVGVGVRYKF